MQQEENESRLNTSSKRSKYTYQMEAMHEKVGHNGTNFCVFLKFDLHRIAIGQLETDACFFYFDDSNIGWGQREWKGFGDHCIFVVEAKAMCVLNIWIFALPKCNVRQTAVILVSSELDCTRAVARVENDSTSPVIEKARNG